MTREIPLLRPTPVTIHDNGDMPWYPGHSITLH
jgi:hypothetical protein